jgi:hypothetical protein
MKRKIILTALIFCVAGMIVFAQGEDMSYYTNEYKRSTATFMDRREVLESVRDGNYTGIGEFYHDALKFFLTKLPDMRTNEERTAAEASARLLCQALGAEEYTDAAPDIWQVVEFFDVARDVNEGLVMQDALIALGQIEARNYVPQIVQRLNNFNTQRRNDVETRRRVQRGVVGAINALEALHDPAGFRPVFFASINRPTASYDTTIKLMASTSLPKILEDPGDVISAIILDNSVDPDIKYVAWQEMLRTRAPDSSKANVAAVALATGWSYSTSTPAQQTVLRNMRMSAIDNIRILGAEDESIYPDLERSYSNNFINVSPNYEEIQKTLSALSALKTDEAVNLLLKFLRELHGRRRDGPWGQKERQIFQWILVYYLGPTKTQSGEVRQLLTTIQRSNEYTGTEQGWARDALRALDQ